MTNDHQAIILKYLAGHPLIERRSDLTAAGIPPDLIGGLLDGLVACGELLIDGTGYKLPHPDIAILRVLWSVKGTQKLGLPKTQEIIAKLRADFPLVNILEEVKNWAMYKLDHPLTAKSNVASQLHTWMKKSLEYGGKSNEGRATTSKRQSTSDDARERSTRQPLS